MIWSPDEIKFLTENYQSESFKELGKYLNKTKNQIEYKLRILKLTKRKFIEWTLKEDNYIINNYFKLTTREMAKALNKLETAIDGRINTLKKLNKILKNKTEIIEYEPIDGEKWLHIKIPTIPGKYLISNFGRVYSILTERILRFFVNRTGYYQVALPNSKTKMITYKVHRLVALHFIKESHTTIRNHVNHKDGNKLNNHEDNLEWVTIQENNQHAIDNNLRPNSIGENNYIAKVTNDYVEIVCRLIANGITNKEICKIMKITNVNERNRINKIRRKILWKHISDKHF